MLSPIAAVRSLGLRMGDLADRLRGRRDGLTPPRRLQGTVGEGDFRATGDAFLRHFVELAGLRPDERVLDIGSGVGRMARPLASYLGPGGSYEGFDPSRVGVEWCRAHITARHPNFRFQLADVRNPAYNPAGALAARDYRFPYPDRSFDFVLATSVFTHMLEGDARHYLGEVARVLAPGGRTLVTWFLLTPNSRELVRSGAAALDFSAADHGHYAVVDEGLPERAVAYDLDWVRSSYEHSGLRVVEPVHHGSWCGRERYRDFQDIVVARVP